MSEIKIHQGQNVKFAREYIRGMNQEDLATKLNTSSSTISRIESQDIIEDDMLKNIALALDVPVQFLKNYAPEKLMNYIINADTVNFNDKAAGHDVNYYYPPELMSEIKDLIQQRIEDARIIGTLEERNRNLQAEIERLKK